MNNESRTYLESIKKMCDSGTYKINEISNIIKGILESDRNSQQQKEVRQTNKNNRQK